MPTLPKYLLTKKGRGAGGEGAHICERVREIGEKRMSFDMPNDHNDELDLCIAEIKTLEAQNKVLQEALDKALEVLHTIKPVDGAVQDLATAVWENGNAVLEVLPKIEAILKEGE